MSTEENLESPQEELEPEDLDREAVEELTTQVMGLEPLPPVAELDRVIGWRLRQIRRAAGLTQEELAHALEGAPAMPQAWRHPQTVGLAERGERQFTAEDLVGLSAFFCVPLGFLVDPGEATDQSQVSLGKTRVPAMSLGPFLEWCSPQGGAEIASLESGPLQLMLQLGGEVRNRPWARHLMRGLPYAEAYRLAREEHLANQVRRLPGPTVIVDDKLQPELRVPVAPWGGMAWVVVRGGEPYTARDEIEADYLRYLMDLGVARRARPKRPPRTKSEGVET